jgi:hypothetical protein
MKSKYISLRILLWVICIYHVAAGLLANIFPEMLPWLAERLAGMQIGSVPEAIALAKPLGVYAMIFGVMMGVAAWNPVKNRAIISVGVILFLVRIVQRLAGLQEAEQVFGVPVSRSLSTVAAVSVFAVALALFRYILYRDMHSGVCRSDD